MTEGFLVGLIVACTLVAGMFFLRFWRRTHDALFLAFAVAFLMDAASRCAVLMLDQPLEANPWIFLVRLVGHLVILVGILQKNRRRAKKEP